MTTSIYTYTYVKFMAYNIYECLPAIGFMPLANTLIKKMNNMNGSKNCYFIYKTNSDRKLL
jgi:hypothetical protein